MRNQEGVLFAVTKKINDLYKESAKEIRYVYRDPEGIRGWSLAKNDVLVESGSASTDIELIKSIMGGWVGGGGGALEGHIVLMAELLEYHDSRFRRTSGTWIRESAILWQFYIVSSGNW